MKNILGYEGKNVVVTGAASGMGQAAAWLLSDLGARVFALDIADVSAPVEMVLKVDMKDTETLDTAVSQLPQQVHALFNCAGVPCPPFSNEDTLMINFVGLRYLTDTLLPRIPEGGAIASIASTAGMGWKANLDTIRDLLSQDNSTAAAAAWFEAHPDVCADAYGFAKQCIIVYTMSKARELAQRGVRINCISPSPTESGFMEKLKGEGEMPAELIDMFLPSNGRYATGAEMGEPLVLLNSRLAGFVSGLNIPVDFGYCAEVLVGDRDDLFGMR
ncbi:MAG: coniferyl-alcohol dehydrogenase [Halioglobus sp.]